jgi:hypothetical protein
VAQEHQLQTDQHKVIENDPDVINSYVLFTPPMNDGLINLYNVSGEYEMLNDAWNTGKVGDT